MLLTESQLKSLLHTTQFVLPKIRDNKMHLKSLKISNFRKFGSSNNIVDFVASKDNALQQENINTIAASTTLIVGKNNAGKTSITKALKKIINENDAIGNDFNFRYLNSLLDSYSNGNLDEPPFLPPFLEFKLTINITIHSKELITNIAPFLTIGSIPSDGKDIDLDITIKYELKEYIKFKEELKIILLKYKQDKNLLFRKFLELIDKTDFPKYYYGVDNEKIDDNKFKLNNLIDIILISADRKLDESHLSKSFNKIITHRYSSEKYKKERESLEEQITDINEKITPKIEDNNKYVNDVLGKIESERLGVKLSSDLTFDKLMSNLIKYEFTEKEFNIPENQFGLGYSNLMNIISQIISYIDQYPEETKQSKINLICIEEPETFMHPQMQELFIKYIDDAVSFLLNNSTKKINSQLIITTHSSHILNSKIHKSNSFNNINYITTIANYSNVVRLNDSAVVPQDSSSKTDKIDDLKFLKKHIKYKVSELFFSDAVIFVEGVTEETLLPFYIEQDKNLNKYYISIFNINGAHGQVYFPLIKLLKVPALIITDLDIERTDEEKFEFDGSGKKTKTEIYTQINDLNSRLSTNTTIHKFNGNQPEGLTRYFEEDNLCCIFQKDAIQGYYATSFEEAFILQNYKNSVLHFVLKEVKPDIFKGIVGKEGEQNFDNLKDNSYKLQKKLSASKSDFANEMLYKIIITENSENLPELPQYIQDGLNWLTAKIKESMNTIDSEIIL